jgi:hypothetical protein
LREEQKVKTSLVVISAMLCMALIFPAFLSNFTMENTIQSSGAPEWLLVDGLVENPLNITYAELRNFPLISEVTTLQCVGAGQGGTKVTYNWTGVPLFYLLGMAKVISGAYREVVFNATDGFSSSVRLETALEPTTILALWANRTDLEHVAYWFGRGYRVVLPCRWGYKWVKWVQQITVVGYDYKGTYEQRGYSDEAIRPNCTMPTTVPPIQNFSTIKTKEYTVQALSNSSIESFRYECTKLIFNVAGPEGTSGYFYVTFPKDLLTDSYRVFVDQNPVEFSQTDADGCVYIYLAYAHSTHTIEIYGNPGAATGGGGGSRHLIT